MVHVWPQDPSIGSSKDELDAANIASHAYSPYDTDYVVEGLGFTVDYTTPQFDVEKGKVKVSQSTGVANVEGGTREHGLTFVVEIEDGEFDAISLTDGAVNYIYLDVDNTQDNTASIEVGTNDPPSSLGSQPYLKIGEIDTTNDEKVELNRYPPSVNQWVRLNTDDTAQDLNTGSWSTVNWTLEENVDPIFEHPSSTEIRINQDGYYRIYMQMYFTSSGARAAPQFRILQNTVALPGIASTGYMRNSTGHNHASCHHQIIIQATAGDTFTIESRQESDDGTTTNPISGENVFQIEKLNR